MAKKQIEPVQGEIVGEFTLDLNNIGEIRIATKYAGPIKVVFVIEDNQTEEFIQKLNKLQALKK